MGDKLSAKKAVMDYEVPLVPGTEYAITDPQKAQEIAQKIGYPVLIKASAGGGGKGMRLVNSTSEFVEKMALAQSEARSSFGDDAVFIEKFVTSPRHIEIQVFADRHGNAVYLFERECSIQRRHQKVIEEAPSAVLTPALRKQMGEAAINVTKACKYEGAGTVEFLLDADMKFYFLEMNTRLQVEHPVTEMITGLDLVEWQIKVARGEQLPLTQNELSINGHAIELRIYAEDASTGFLPNIGKLERYRPNLIPDVRYDHGFEEGMEIPLFYDSMLGKLCAWGKTREEAIAKAIEAIENFELSGFITTLDFGKYVLKHPAFTSGKFDTKFIETYFSKESLFAAQNEEEKVLPYILDRVFQKMIEQQELQSRSVNI
jgi:propionyl-CoA carboxylase alpha chain